MIKCDARLQGTRRDRRSHELVLNSAFFSDQMEHFDTAKQLHQIWLDRVDHLKPGDEFSLIDAFADILGLRSWYTWDPDSIAQSPAPSPLGQTASPTQTFSAKNTPPQSDTSTRPLIRFDQLTPEQIQTITFEIGRIGQQGINYSDPQRTHHLDSLPGESFSGLELICLPFAGFKRLYPQTNTGIDLDEPFLQTLELFHERTVSGYFHKTPRWTIAKFQDILTYLI